MREKQTRVTTHHDKYNNEGMEQMAFEYKEESCSRCDPLQIKGLSVYSQRCRNDKNYLGLLLESFFFLPQLDIGQWEPK